MKRKLKRAVAVILTAAMTMLVGMPAFAAEDNVENTREAFYITETTTLGEIIRHTNPEGYAEIPNERKAILNETYIKDCTGTDKMESDSTRAIIFNASIIPNIANITRNSFDYAAVLEMNMAANYAYMELLVYDAATGLLLMSDYDSGFEEDELTINGTADGLENNHHYNVFIFADIIPPDGYITLVDQLDQTLVVKTPL